MKTAPPKEIGCRSCEVDVVIRPEKAFEFPILAENSVWISAETFFFFFFFWRSPVFELKKRLNFRFWSENPSEFWRRPFFLEITCFWAEKAFEFTCFPRNSISIFGQTVWFWFKTNENSGQGRLQFSHCFKKAPPFFQILATRLVQPSNKAFIIRLQNTNLYLIIRLLVPE